MHPKDIIHETYLALSANKVRSGLTILGIVIGISSVIAMIAIGAGAQSSIEANIQSIGSNLVMVMPGSQRGPGAFVSGGRGSARTLTQEDADAIQTDISGIRAVSPELSGRYQVTAKGKNTNTSVVGVVAAYPTVRNVSVDLGSFISDTQFRSLSKVAVLGPTVRDDLFGEGVDPTGSTIRIKNIEFKVIGVTKSKGGSGFGNQDDTIFIPLSTAQRFLAGDAFVSNIALQAESTDVMATVQGDVSALLLMRHKISDPALQDFSVINQADILATASSITDTFTILLSAIAGISLLVGGIGIMNMMLTTVTERTKEIGLRKAVGAKRRDIELQFLFEAIMLTGLGGLIGILLGLSEAWLLTYSGVLKAEVTLSSILLAFGVAALIGIVFGYYPAQRAAKLDPIDALRYE
jgi:putative ABC transport system permease protein